MLHPSTQKLIDRLATMTARGRIEWAEAGNGEVVYATEGYVVRLSDAPPQMALATANGAVLETATADQLNGAVYDGQSTYADLVAGIVRDAHRVARGTEEAISTLLQGLADTGPKTRKIIDDSGVREVPLEEPPRAAAPPPATEPEPAPPAAPAPAEPDAATSGHDQETPGDTDSTRADTPDEVDAFTVQPETAPALPEEPDVTAPEAAGLDEMPQAASAQSTFRYMPFARPAQPADAEPEDEQPPVTPAEASPLPENDDGGDSRIESLAPRYIPFGASGLELAGSEASVADQAAHDDEDEIDSELAAAAATMQLPEAAAQADTAPTSAPPSDATEPETPQTGTETVAHPYAPEKPAGPVDDLPRPAASYEPETPAPEPDAETSGVTLSGLGAGHGFGARGGFRPRPPKPAGSSQPPAAPQDKAPAFIDATDDSPAQDKPGNENKIPEVTNLGSGEKTGSDDTYAGTSIPQEDVHADAASQKTSATQPRRRPARPKTRFNPWS